MLYPVTNINYINIITKGGIIVFSKRFAALFLAIMLILGIAGEAMASDDDFRVRVTVAPEKGGTVTGAGSYNYGEEVTLTAIPNEGYVFVKWTWSGSKPGSDPDPSLENQQSLTFEATRDIEFTCHFKKTSTYTASFDPNGGTGSVDDITGLSEGETVTLPGGEGLSREAYTFKGWSTAPDGPVISEYTMEASNVTFYAVWEKIPTYTASFDLNGGTGSVDDITSLSAGETVTLPDGAGLSRNGYKFKGWAFHNGKVIKGSFTMPDHDVTLFAVWVSDSAVEPPKSGDGIDLTGLNMMLGALELSAFMALRKRESESTK